MTLIDVLPTAIWRSGLTYYRIAKETGIPKSNLRRFVQGEMSVRLDGAEILADFSGL